MTGTGGSKEDGYLMEVARRRSVRENIGWLRRNLAPIRVIYTDMDGTLVGPLGCFFRDSEWKLTPKPAHALLAALSRNVDVMLVSGRHKSQLRESARLLGINNYIAELGTEIVYGLGAEVIENIGSLEKTCPSVYETITDTGVVDLLLKSYPLKLEMHTPWSEERDCTPLLRGNVDLDGVRKLLDENGFAQFELIDNGVIPRKSPTLDVPMTRVYHLVPGGVRKDRAVVTDQEHRNLRREETVAVGDAEADLGFGAVTGAFFMVRNGLINNPHLAEAIDRSENVFVTEGEMGLGWAEVVETVLGL